MLTLAVCWLSACATTRSQPPTGTAETEQTMNTLRAQNAGYVRRIEELQNKIFILEDRLDSLRTTAQPQPTPRVILPRKRTEPATTTTTAAGEEPAHDQAQGQGQGQGQGQEDDSGAPEIEFAGEAAIESGVAPGKGRVTLRGGGAAPPRVRRR